MVCASALLKMMIFHCALTGETLWEDNKLRAKDANGKAIVVFYNNENKAFTIRSYPYPARADVYASGEIVLKE